MDITDMEFLFWVVFIGAIVVAEVWKTYTKGGLQ